MREVLGGVVCGEGCRLESPCEQCLEIVRDHVREELLLRELGVCVKRDTEERVVARGRVGPLLSRASVDGVVAHGVECLRLRR
jgi:hypothetical protein